MPASEDPSPARHPTRCLLVLPTSMGEALALRGLIGSLAAAGRQLITVTSGDQAAVLDPTLLALRLENTPEHLDAPLSAGRHTFDAKKLRALGCDEAILLDRSWWAARLSAAGIPRRAGPPCFFSAFLTQRLPAGAPHLFDSAPKWAEALAIPWRAMPTIHVSGAWERLGRDRLMKARVELKAPKIGLYRGRHGGRGGTWPDSHFEELARQLRRRYPKIQIVILSTDNKVDLWKSVLLYEQTGKIHPVIGPDLNDDGIAAVLSHLDLFVAADSSMLHIAAAVGTATLGLFEKDALRIAPRGESTSSVQRAPLKKVSVEEILQRIDEIGIDLA